MSQPVSEIYAQPVPFKAETRQLLNILIHSLYTEREVFLRELISNASDALTRLHFESLTNREILDPQAELAIWIETDPQQRTLTIRDSGIGMNAEELAQNLGTIAHSGAKAFLEAAQKGDVKLNDIIGQFGVGFYSAFMVAEKIEVNSRSYRLNDSAARWISSGEDTFIVEPSDKSERGTTIKIHLKEDASEFCDENRLRQIIRKHSDYIPYPIYIGNDKEPANQRTSLWRQPPQQISEEEYRQFYRQFTLDFQDPLLKIHLSIDAPVQLYALLYVPASAERSPFGLRKEEGLKLYARKVLIQEYAKELLPSAFLHFLDGVVDSEDLPLNVSRESVQSNRVMAQIKRILTNKVIDTLKTLAKEKPEEYNRFWVTHGRSIREAIATDADLVTALQPLLRYHSLNHPAEWISLDDYLLKSPANQTCIYYLTGDHQKSLENSPHLDIFRKRGMDVLFLTDPLDPFVLIRIPRYNGHDLVNAAGEDLKLPQQGSVETTSTTTPAENGEEIVQRFKKVLGERVTDVRLSPHPLQAPLRLVIPEGTIQPEFHKVYRLLNQNYEPPKPILELNAGHPILIAMLQVPADSPILQRAIELLYESALLLEGLHPDPTELAPRIQDLIQQTLEKTPHE
ncbi:MAG TPA: molecular chaperone HtpG [Anaerolineaceae bacterium]|nr:molecular chaperone HtpG [Anaerolineaceae bacterium]